jgi:hypothetical protein
MEDEDELRALPRFARFNEWIVNPTEVDAIGSYPVQLVRLSLLSSQPRDLLLVELSSPTARRRGVRSLQINGGGIRP